MKFISSTLIATTFLTTLGSAAVMAQDAAPTVVLNEQIDLTARIAKDSGSGTDDPIEVTNDGC